MGGNSIPSILCHLCHVQVHFPTIQSLGFGRGAMVVRIWCHSLRFCHLLDKPLASEIRTRFHFKQEEALGILLWILKSQHLLWLEQFP